MFVVILRMQKGFEGYFKKANDFAFLKTPALEENFISVTARKFGGRGIPAPIHIKQKHTEKVCFCVLFLKRLYQKYAVVGFWYKHFFDCLLCTSPKGFKNGFEAIMDGRAFNDEGELFFERYDSDFIFFINQHFDVDFEKFGWQEFRLTLNKNGSSLVIIGVEFFHPTFFVGFLKGLLVEV
ncbi:MAG: hypothetical protein HGA61_00110 [Candidatus Moranbacteria bacterium]|nr:hypothetical protein [Candidatus Moranbacteria bacterium]